MPANSGLKCISSRLPWAYACHRADGRGCSRPDWLAVEGHFRGRHEKDLVGPQGTIAAQGKDLNMPYADFFRIRNGKIIEHNVYWDQVGMLAQPHGVHVDVTGHG